jgi:hypothetical protein
MSKRSIGTAPRLESKTFPPVLLGLTACSFFQPPFGSDFGKHAANDRPPGVPETPEKLNRPEGKNGSAVRTAVTFQP